MREAFTTERLQVFEVLCQRDDDDCFDKIVYLAYWKCLDEPAVVCTATVNHDTLIGDYLEWVETKEDERRRGIAFELIQGIVAYRGRELVIDGVSDAGKALEEKYRDYATKLNRLVEAASAVIIQRQKGPVVGWNYDAIGVAALNELTAALKEIELKGEHGEQYHIGLARNLRSIFGHARTGSGYALRCPTRPAGGDNS